MLIPAKVISFLQFERLCVRDLAIRYLANANDPTPATADDFWRAIDHFGAKKNAPAVLDLHRELSKLPQTEQSIDQTLKALATEKDETSVLHLERVLAHLNYGMMLRSQDLIEEAPVISPKLREHVKKRIELAYVPAAELWDQLAEVSKELDSADESNRANLDHAERLVEALSRHPEAAQWAISMLMDPKQLGFLEIHSVELLGRMRFRPAAELVFDKLIEDEEGAFLIEASTRALSRIGSADVVRFIRDRWDKIPEGVRYTAAEILGRIKLPQSELALIALLDREKDQTARTFLASALCEIGATEPAALQALREMVESKGWDESTLELDSDVAGLFTMVGHRVPELDRWHDVAEKRDAKWRAEFKRLNKVFSDGGKSASATSQYAAPSSMPDDMPWDESTPPWDQPQSPAPPSKLQPLKRQGPKVGRNDPCPCGSGKKYKKCCGKG